jgi:8-oxo-dGTP pyrophosphatase MutT (NUDIX family)
MSDRIVLVITTGAAPVYRCIRFGVCPYCYEYGHSIKECLSFKVKRMACTNDITVCKESELKTVNVEGCCAAGVVPYTYVDKKLKLHVIREIRDGRVLYNFPGGKRDSAHETPRIIAERELREETGLEARVNKDALVLWCGPSKFVLYPIHVSAISLHEITCCGETKLDTVDANSAKDDEWHPFAWKMFQAIKSHGFDKFMPQIP